MTPWTPERVFAFLAAVVLFVLVVWLLVVIVDEIREEDDDGVVGVDRIALMDA